MSEVTTAQHTLGPWYAAKDYYGGWCIRTTPADATNIDGEGTVFANTGRGSGSPSEADANLIAAAPELLAAAQRAWEHEPHCQRDRFGVSPRDDCRCISCSLKAAIAKAKGEQPS